MGKIGVGVHEREESVAEASSGGIDGGFNSAVGNAGVIVAGGHESDEEETGAVEARVLGDASEAVERDVRGARGGGGVGRIGRVRAPVLNDEVGTEEEAIDVLGHDGVDNGILAEECTLGLGLTGGEPDGEAEELDEADHVSNEEGGLAYCLLSLEEGPMGAVEHENGEDAEVTEAAEAEIQGAEVRVLAALSGTDLVKPYGSVDTESEAPGRPVV
ncbi:unnamed protein product, partial [Pneumocystis jirovecii]